ncbi:hypothetical protein Tco_1283091 [Tanacetum coccineum]
MYETPIGCARYTSNGFCQVQKEASDTCRVKHNEWGKDRNSCQRLNFARPVMDCWISTIFPTFLEFYDDGSKTLSKVMMEMKVNDRSERKILNHILDSSEYDEDDGLLQEGAMLMHLRSLYAMRNFSDDIVLWEMNSLPSLGALLVTTKEGLAYFISQDKLKVKKNVLRLMRKRKKTFGRDELEFNTSDSMLMLMDSMVDEEDLGEDASKQGRRINAIDADEDITLVNVKDDVDNEMFDVDALNVRVWFVAE